MKSLRIHNFQVKDVLFGDETKYENNILYINVIISYKNQI